MPIEYPGHNWDMQPAYERLPSIDIIEPPDKPKAKSKKKTVPFGFARALQEKPKRKPRKSK